MWSGPPMISAPDAATSGTLVSYVKHSVNACINNKITTHMMRVQNKAFCSAMESHNVWGSIDKKAQISIFNNTAPDMANKI